MTGAVTSGGCDQGVYTPPPQTVNKRVVSILLEYFLVQNMSINDVVIIRTSKNIGDFFLNLAISKTNVYLKTQKNMSLTSLTRAKCGTRSTLCWKILNISDSTELFAL